jgi:uncharacterized BrkB/YihY/UPF0761 family membrane protein
VKAFSALPLSWPELARRTYQKATADNYLDLAAQLSYYFFLALFPAILFLLALASFFPLQNLTDESARQSEASPLRKSRSSYRIRCNAWPIRIAAAC